jgi:hypothetical protein
VARNRTAPPRAPFIAKAASDGGFGHIMPSLLCRLMAPLTHADGNSTLEPEEINCVITRARSAAAMRLQTYRDQTGSRHFDLIGGGGHPWSVDLVAITASGILVLGFACALVALWVH